MKIEFNKRNADYEVGESIGVRVHAAQPFDANRAVLLGLDGTLEVFAPGSDPEGDPVDRAAPDASSNFVYNEEVGYVAWVDTAGLTPAGTWTLRVRLHDADGDFDSVKYTTFTLRE